MATEMWMDSVIIIVRFLLGVLLGGILAFWMMIWFSVPLSIGGLFALLVGVLSGIWGDRFILWFLNIFKAL